VKRDARLGDRVIVALVPDLIVSVRIEEAAKTLGTRVETTDSMDEAFGRLRSAGMDVVVVDLAMAGLDIDGVATAAREAGASVIGFYPHVEVALRRAALDAGIEDVYARSRFLRDLPGILRERLDG
jgi:CheY-like chemotaxis protein